MTLIRPTRRGLIAGGLALGLAGRAVAQDSATAPEAPATGREVLEMALGDENAPVTVVEYASLTCPHCRSFHMDAFGRIKENYIDTGKVRMVMRDVYFDRLGLWAAMVARCDKGWRYFGIIDRLFEKQPEWSRAATAEEALQGIFAIGRQAGLTDEQMGECVQDRAWAEALVAEYQKNVEADDVTGTPTFFINGRKEGNMPYEEFARKLDAELDS